MCTLRNILIILSAVVFTHAAKADYTCNDRQYLREILLRLDASCGGGGGSGVCSAYGYKGSTVESAIRSCQEAGYSLNTCNSNTTCSDGTALCSAYGYKGSNVESAIKSCTSAGYSLNTCNGNTQCSGNVRVCEAYGYKGDSIESAIANCMAAGYSRNTCNSNSSCH